MSEWEIVAIVYGLAVFVGTSCVLGMLWAAGVFEEHERRMERMRRLLGKR